MGKEKICFLSREDLYQTADSRLRLAKIGYIVLSVLIGLLGISLLAFPAYPLGLLCWLGGGLLILFGCIRIVGYYSRDLYRLAFQYDLAFGILLIVLGLVLILRTQVILPRIGLLLGLFVLTDALLKIQIALDARQFGISRWWLILAVSLITGGEGLVLLLRPSADAGVIMALVGLSFLGEGLMNLVTVLTAVQILNRRFPQPPGESRQN